MNAVCGSLNVSSYLVATEVRTEAVFIGSAGVNTFARSKFAKSVDHSFTRHIHEVQRQLAERQRALFLSTYTFFKKLYLRQAFPIDANRAWPPRAMTAGRRELQNGRGSQPILPR